MRGAVVVMVMAMKGVHVQQLEAQAHNLIEGAVEIGTPKRERGAELVNGASVL